MYNDHSKGIKVLSIIVLIFSILTAIGLIFSFVAIALGWSMAGDYISSYSGSLYIDGYGSISGADANSLLGLGMGVVMAALIWEAITTAVSIVASILALRAVGQYQKYQTPFIWCVIAAVAMFLSARIVSMVLFIILAVFLSQDRKAATAASVTYPYAQNYGAPNYGQGYNQGYQQNYQGYSAPAGAPYGAPNNYSTPAYPNAAPQAGTAPYGQGYGDQGNGAAAYGQPQTPYGTPTYATPSQENAPYGAAPYGQPAYQQAPQQGAQQTAAYDPMQGFQQSAYDPMQDIPQPNPEESASGYWPQTENPSENR